MFTRTKIALFISNLDKNEYFNKFTNVYNVDTITKVIDISNKPNLNKIIEDIELKTHELVQDGYTNFFYTLPNYILIAFLLGKTEVKNKLTGKFEYVSNPLRYPVSIRFPQCFFIVGNQAILGLDGSPNGVIDQVSNLYRFYDLLTTYDYSLIRNGWTFYETQPSNNIFIGGQQYSPVNGNFQCDKYFSPIPKEGFKPLFQDVKYTSNSKPTLNDLSTNNPNIVYCLIEKGDRVCEFRFEKLVIDSKGINPPITIKRYDLIFDKDSEIFVGDNIKGINTLDLFMKDISNQLDASLKKICVGALINRQKWSNFQKTIYDISCGKLLSLQLKDPSISSLTLIQFLNNVINDNFTIASQIQKIFNINEGDCKGLIDAINISRKDRLSLVNIFWEPTPVEKDFTKYPPLPTKIFRLYPRENIFSTKFMSENGYNRQGQLEDKTQTNLLDMPTQENFCGFMGETTTDSRLNYNSTQNNRFLIDNNRNFVSSFVNIYYTAPNSFDKGKTLLVQNPKSFQDPFIPNTNWSIYYPNGNNKVPIVCLLYLKNGDIAERSSKIIEIFNIYKRENGYILDAFEIEITGDSNIDSKNLNLAKNLTNIFISALPSLESEYLQNIFFNQNQECLHIASRSTATSLEKYTNLLRVNATDDKVAPVFTKIVKRRKQSIYIVTEDGVYTQGLTQEIANNCKIENIPVIKIVNVTKGEYDPQDIANQAKNNNLTVIYITFKTNILFQRLEKVPGIDKIPFNIMGSDSVGEDLPTETSTIKFLQSKNAEVIFAFTSDRELETATRYQLIINDPLLPVSSLLYQTLACFDIFGILSRCDKRFYQIRKDYVLLYLNKFLDNSDAVYGLYSYLQLQQLSLKGLSLLYRDKYFNTF